MTKHTKNRGFLRPDELYNTHGVMRAIGLGRAQLMEARASGIVKPIFYGGSAYYRGSELIEFITTHGTREYGTKGTSELSDAND